MTDPGEIRASDAEREAVVEQLRVASVEGRLTLAELTDRTEAAYTAATQAELAMLTQDLPAGAAPAPAAPAATGRRRRWFVGIMGDSKRRGTWRIDQELGAVAVMGDVVLDLREAEVRTSSVDIMAVSVMGDVKIIVPDGVNVDLDGVAIMGDKKVDVLEGASGANVPVVRVQAYAVMGDVKVVGDSRAKPIKHKLSAWREHWRMLHGEDWRELGRQLRHETRELNRQVRDMNRDLGRGY
ncbi:DUF1707 domain-containing protein [Nonomuraea sp. KC401]|uniref:DUF1707 SHOCT-like domain-containing protein n=1 Tax=unclassified Nonomuraea TaxID=2593643 RepID=UPI0010FCF9A7|nr:MULTISPECIES: DUF1707 domain-containing protein [unclassified Nonomuraea]NBE92557.1 DUF1707 domain-containing protein [Nonomuraea sp. K271]TLF79753.1 DUF1707 domain-containing protein [Nonomuraea sp. KC401]